MKTQQTRPKVDNHFLIVASEVNYVDRIYPTEKACFSEIWRRVRQDKRCQFCGSTRLKVKSGNRTGNCGKCGKKFWLTAGTIFERVRVARPYFVAIHLAEKGVPFSARVLSRVCDIAYATALQISKKVMSAVLDAMRESAILVSSFEFDSVICKRSLETAARKHPVSEQENAIESTLPTPSTTEQAFEERIAVFKPAALVCASDMDADRSEPVACPEKRIYELLTKEPQSIDQLIAASRLQPNVVIATVSILELTDLATLVTGNRVVLSAERLSTQLPQLDLQAQACLDHVKWFIKKFYHGVSRKYIQIYLAAYWCFIDRVRWADGAVFKQCCKTANIDMRTFVSPLDLQFCAA